MSKKTIDEQTVVNELKGNSLFFERSSPIVGDATKQVGRAPVIDDKGIDESKNTYHTAPGSLHPQKRSNEVSAIPDANSKKKETIMARYHDTTPSWNQETVIEMIRKAVKQLGKEAATHRFTQEEKKLLRDLVYMYETRGIKTSENEITRIAIHYLVKDYHENNENSVLAKVLEKLNS